MTVVVTTNNEEIIGLSDEISKFGFNSDQFFFLQSITFNRDIEYKYILFL